MRLEALREELKTAGLATLYFLCCFLSGRRCPQILKQLS
jgi:hypothetical protein